jgi:hypothetical protein
MMLRSLAFVENHPQGELEAAAEAIQFSDARTLLNSVSHSKCANVGAYFF